MKPTFMILGAAKAGTTSLYYYLKQHPDVFMSYPKEPFFFEAEYEKGIDYYIHKYFKGWKGERAVGEARHRNLFLPYVPDRIAETLPNAQFIILVRNPIDRAFSHWWHWYVRGCEPLPFEDALEDNFKRLKKGPFFKTKEEIELYIKTLDEFGGSPFRTYIDSGYYAEQIQRYIFRFGKERIKIIFFEDLINNPQGTVGDVFDFLGIEQILICNISAKNRALSLTGATMCRVLKAVPLRRVMPTLLKNNIRQLIETVFVAKKEKINPKTRQMLAEHFLPHNKKLKILTGRMLNTGCDFG